MKKIINFLKNPFYVGTVAGISFIVATIDSIINNVNSASDLTTLGKSALIIFMIAFTIVFIRGMIAPVVMKIIKFFK